MAVSRPPRPETRGPHTPPTPHIRPVNAQRSSHASPSPGRSRRRRCRTHAHLRAAGLRRPTRGSRRPAQGRPGQGQGLRRPKYHGKHTVFTRSVPNLPAHGFDRIGSAKNIGKRTVTFYQHINYSGAHFSLKPGESELHFGNHPAMGPHSLHFR
ncbi:peptidase inhibitor family I36 protein [Streptomyces lydicamycinicus]|uniref:peptidase inhibitor family I36 protein n=1 Tax=Streptomyces lydicamycinicus TaxID=1546107 RepID=UPI003C2D2CD1